MNDLSLPKRLGGQHHDRGSGYPDLSRLAGPGFDRHPGAAGAAQKWLNEGRASTSIFPRASTKRACPCPAATVPMSVTATPAAAASWRNASILSAGTHAKTS